MLACLQFGLLLEVVSSVGQWSRESDPLCWECELNSTVESVPIDVSGSLQIKKWSRVCFMFFFNICFIADIVLLCNRVDKYLL